MSILKRAMLKDIVEGDLSFLLKWRNQEAIREVMFNSDFISWEQHSKWFDKLRKDDTAKSKIFYFDSIPYGVVNISKINSAHNTCEWGFYLGSPNASKGMGSILGYTALNYIFQELKIRKLFAQVIDFNEKSIVFHNKMGFKQEGKLRSNIVKNGKCIDILQYRLLATEWEIQSIILRKLIEGRFI